MGRPRTIFINRDKMLAGMHQAHQEELAAEQARDFGWHHNWELLQLREHGARIDLERWLDQPLTASERIRAGEAVRALESEGFIKVYGIRASRARLTPAGLERLAALEQQVPVTAPTEPRR